ncbi:MAG: HAMP domain-containing protein [Synergistaceae bacterium]|jgi:HPt (histidine-containing phosphotransfer) domain-containing protein/HAMP domain-containing protein|nr:HAMP domain-containing protein [Synergistaceae bacterium]
MRDAIWKKILFFAVIPFLFIFVLLSLIIVQAVYRDKIIQAGSDVRALAMYNEANLRDHLDSARVSLLTIVSELEKIAPDYPDARERAENTLVSMMKNNYVFNSWFAYEPMAFDGRDPEFTSDYPGAPSGRFLRSFTRNGETYAATPDMNEHTIDNPDECPWYAIPADTGQPFIDVDISALYDSGLGAGGENAISLSMPVKRGGKVIGVAGADILFNQTLLGTESPPGAVSALFTNKYQLISAPKSEDIGKFIDDLGFSQIEEIKSAFDEAREMFLFGEQSHFLDAQAYAYIKPLRLDGFDQFLYLYEAIPEGMVNEAMSPVLVPVAVSLIIALLLFSSLLAYISQAITKPMHSLAAAAQAISHGDMAMEIAASDARDEIGMVSRAIHMMVEQFRVHITLLERSGDLLDLYMKLNEAVYRNDDIKDSFDAMAQDICLFFGVSSVSLVFITDDLPILKSRFDAGCGFSVAGKTYAHHEAVSGLLAGNKYVFLNSRGMLERKVSFADMDTTSVCVLPIMISGELRGYFILEGKDAGVFVSDDAHLVFISETLSYIMSQKEMARDVALPIAPESLNISASILTGFGSTKRDNATPLMEALRKIEELDVDRGVMLSGDSQENYLKLLRVFLGSSKTGVDKSKGLLAEGDLRNFAIEIHGMKGALYSVGADTLGDVAFSLEKAAKAGSSDLCEQGYPSFVSSLSAFMETLRSALEEDDEPTSPGSVEELALALPRAIEACRKYNMFLAIDIMTPFSRFEYEPAINERLRKIDELLNSMEYDEAMDSMSLLGQILRKD